MPLAERRLDDAHHHDRSKRHDERIGWECKENTRLADSAQVNERQCRKNGEAQRQRVRQERWDGGNKRTHPRRDAHGDVEHIVQGERGAGKKPQALTKVFFRHRVGAAASGVGGDGLTIRNVDDEQDANDEGGNGPHIAQAQDAQGKEDREESLGSIGGGGQAVEPEDRDSRQKSNVMVLLLLRRERSTEEPVEECHRVKSPETSLTPTPSAQAPALSFDASDRQNPAPSALETRAASTKLDGLELQSRPPGA